MARTTVLHVGAPLSLVSLLVDHEAVSGNDCANLVFFLLSTDAEHLVMDLDRGEILGEDLSVAQTDLRRCLRRQFVDH